MEHIEKKALGYPGVLGIHDLMIHDYGPGNRLVSFHIEMDAKGDVMQSHDVIDSIEKDLLVQDGMIATIHYDPIVTGNAHVEEIRSFLQQQVAQLEPKANLHDLRIVPGPSHTNVIFDCAVPARIPDRQAAPRCQAGHRPAHGGSAEMAGPFLCHQTGTRVRTFRTPGKLKKEEKLWTTIKLLLNCMPKAPVN